MTWYIDPIDGTTNFINQHQNYAISVGCWEGSTPLFGLVLDVGIMWICSIGMGVFAAFVLKMPMPWVYIFLVSDEIIKIPFSVYRYKTYKWLRNVTR